MLLKFRKNKIITVTRKKCDIEHELNGVNVFQLDSSSKSSQTANEKIENYLSSVERELHFAEINQSQPTHQKNQNSPVNRSMPIFSMTQVDQPRQIKLDQNKTFTVDSLSNAPQPQLLPYIKIQQIDTTTNLVTNHKSESRDNSCNVSNHPDPVDKLIDNLVQGQEKFIPENKENITKSLQQGFETRGLSVVELVTFDRNPCHWLGFITNFKTRIHLKKCFTDNMRMEKLLNIFKKSIESISKNGIFM